VCGIPRRGRAVRGCRRGRMTKAEVSAREERPAAEKQPEKEARQTSLEEQARAQRRIAALERALACIQHGVIKAIASDRH
jgi:hypothetical protein